MIDVEIGQSIPPRLDQLKYLSRVVINVNITAQTPVVELMNYLSASYQSIQNYPLKVWLIPKNTEAIQVQKKKVTALGGTFDHLHSGHLLLLTQAALVTEECLHVGITSDTMLQKKKGKQFMQSLRFRIKEVESFLSSFKIKTNLFPLMDPYGPTITQQNFDALVVSRETIEGGHQINKIRQEKGFRQLQLHIIDIIESKQSKLSSTDIRYHLQSKNNFTEEMMKNYRLTWLHILDQPELRELMAQQFDSIFEAYSEHWRHFHTNYHIYKMVTRKLSKMPQDTTALKFSIFFHDIVYQPDRKDNEEKSGQKWMQFIAQVEQKLQKDLGKLKTQVYDAIISTKQHRVESNQPLFVRVLCDLDMAILSARKQTYEQYSQWIRAEYRPLFKDEAEYNLKRKEFLMSMDVQKVYNFAEEFDLEQLKRNLEWEIGIL